MSLSERGESPPDARDALPIVRSNPSLTLTEVLCFLFLNRLDARFPG